MRRILFGKVIVSQLVRKYSHLIFPYF